MNSLDFPQITISQRRDKAFDVKIRLEVMKIYMSALETKVWWQERGKQFFKRRCLIKVMGKKGRIRKKESNREEGKE